MRTRLTRFAAVFGGLFSLFISNSTSHAVTVYSYTSANFDVFPVDATPPSGSYTTAMNVSGNFTVAAPFAANLSGALPTSIFLDLSFTDGRQTINLANFDPIALGSFISVNTDALGTITSFQLGFTSLRPTSVGGQFGQIRGSDAASGAVFDECLAASGGICTEFGVDTAEGPAGDLTLTSTDVAQTPLPAALPMFMAGAGMMGLLARRRKRKADV